MPEERVQNIAQPAERAYRPNAIAGLLAVGFIPRGQAERL